MNEHEKFRKETQSIMYVDERHYEALLKDVNFYSQIPVGEAYGDWMGRWLTPYAVIKVVLLRPKCDTCANYKPKGGQL